MLNKKFYNNLQKVKINQIKMQQNYVNPQAQQVPDINNIKRSIEYKNYQYNQTQLQQRQEIHKRQKQFEIQQSAYYNQQALVQLENDKLKELRKKYLVQDALQKEYDRQIYVQKRVKTQEKSYDKIYSQKQREMLQIQQKSRIKAMTKIYDIGSYKKQKNPYLQHRNIRTQGCQDSLDMLRKQNYQQQIRQFNQNNQTPTHFQNQNDYIPRTANKKSQSLPQIQKQSLQNSRNKKYSIMNLDYADYLKREIERKQRQKQEQRRKQLERDKTWINRQNKSYYENLEQSKYLNQKKKYDYATGLEKQLLWKRQYQRKF